MTRRLLILAFLMSVSVNSLTAAPLFMDGSACATGCCKKTRFNRDSSPSSQLCCLLDCSQPVDSTGGSLRISVQPPVREASMEAGESAAGQVAYLRSVRFPSSPTRSIRGSTHHFLDNATLLI
jgi:hypothetical protein